jgi:hypothetical protein
MQCIIHAANEAVDVCRVCGKPICAVCGTDSQDRFICERCERREPPEPGPARTAAAPSPPIAPRRHRSPVVAALLSFLPGLGQAYNGDYLKALVFFSCLTLLLSAADRAPTLRGFAVLLLLWQIYEAYHRARELRRPPDPAAEPGPAGATSPLLDWLLVAFGLVLFAINLTLGRFPVRLDLILPALVILAGIALLVSYFRTGEEARP